MILFGKLPHKNMCGIKVVIFQAESIYSKLHFLQDCGIYFQEYAWYGECLNFKNEKVMTF